MSCEYQVEVMIPPPLEIVVDPVDPTVVETVIAKQDDVEVLVVEDISVEVQDPAIFRSETVVLEGVQPIPVAGAGITMVFDEVPFGAVDGLNVNFSTVHPFQTGGLLVYINGLRQCDPQDYVETSTQAFQLTQAPLIGDSVRVDYLRF